MIRISIFVTLIIVFSFVNSMYTRSIDTTYDSIKYSQESHTNKKVFIDKTTELLQKASPQMSEELGETRLREVAKILFDVEIVEIKKIDKVHSVDFDYYPLVGGYIFSVVSKETTYNVFVGIKEGEKEYFQWLNNYLAIRDMTNGKDIYHSFWGRANKKINELLDVISRYFKTSIDTSDVRIYSIIRHILSEGNIKSIGEISTEENNLYIVIELAKVGQVCAKINTARDVEEIRLNDKNGDLIYIAYPIE